MKTLLCRMLALTFLLNVLTPDARLFAQEKKGVPAFSLTGADVNYSPETDERIAKSVFANMKVYDPATDTYKNWNPTFVDEANLRLFLHNAPDAAFLDYITTHKLPADTWTVGMNEYVPGLNLQHNSDKVYSAVLRRLNLMLEKNQLPIEVYTDMIGAPSDEIASFAALNLVQVFKLLQQDPDTLHFLVKSFVPAWQQAALKRLAQASGQKNDSAVLAPRAAMETLLKDQYRPVENIALRGNLHLFLATLRDAHRSTQIPDPVSPAKYKELADGVLQSVDYARTHKEWWMGSNATRLLNAEYAAMNLIAYEGIAGFERLVDFYESQNKVTKFQAESPTSFNLKKVSLPQQSVINTANFTQIQRAFSAMTNEYGPQVASRQQALDPKELAKLRDVLLKYANHGSAAVRVLALSTLADFYAKTGAQWTNGRGYDQGAKSGLFISPKAANQVADIIKEKYYCPLVISPKSGVFGLNAQEMLKMTQMLGDAYNSVRQDPQSYVSQKGKSLPCYVSTQQTLNRSAQAEDLTDDVMWFIVSWWGIGAAFKAVSAGATAAGNMLRAAQAAAKAPARLQASAFKAALKEAKDASKMARELAKSGITVERSYVYGTANGAKNTGVREAVQNMTKTRVPHPSKELTTGYRVTQRLPGGTVTTRFIEPAQNTGRLLTDGKTVLNTSQGPLSQFFDIAGETVSTLPKAGPQLTAYRSVIATEDLMHAGLKTLAAQNAATGFGMFKKLVPDAAGKLTVEHTPVYLRLSPTDPVAHYNSAGRMITGNVRADLLPAMERPGAVLSASLYGPSVEGLNYLKWITGISARFYAYDLFSQPILNKWEDRDFNQSVARQTEGMTREEIANADGKSPFRPEKSYSDYFMDNAENSGFTGAFFSLIGQGISRATTSAAKWLFLPNVSKTDRDALLEKNPYMKMYREKMQEWEKAYELQRQADELLEQMPGYADQYDEEYDLYHQTPEDDTPVQDLDEKGNLVILTPERFNQLYPEGTLLIHDTDEHGTPVLRTNPAYKKAHPETQKAAPAASQTEEDEYTLLEDYL